MAEALFEMPSVTNVIECLGAKPTYNASAAVGSFARTVVRVAAPPIPKADSGSRVFGFRQNLRWRTFPRKVRQVKPGEGGWYVKD
jgi:hypothetical protein